MIVFHQQLSSILVPIDNICIFSIVMKLSLEANAGDFQMCTCP